MIEFKAAFYKNKTTPPQSVLVQFDGVLLHVWHMSNPFHRILSSDVFEMSTSIGRRRYIKLPNGGRIETDDMQALAQLQSKCRPWLDDMICHSLHRRRGILILFGIVTVLITVFFAYCLLG